MSPAPVSIAFAVMHAAFAAERIPMAQRLVATIQRELGPHDRLHLERDDVRRGNWPVAEACLRWGISEATTHVVLMNDDALPCPGFVEGVRAALSAQPSEFISFYPNDETELDAREAGDAWWVSSDGLVSMCAAFPRALLAEFLAWQAESILEYAPVLPEDTRFELWAMCHDRKIWHARGLVEHGAPQASLIGTNAHAFRTAAAPPPSTQEETRAIDWTKGLDDPFDAGLLYFFPSPRHMLERLTDEAKVKHGVEARADALWGENAAECRRLMAAARAKREGHAS